VNQRSGNLLGDGSGGTLAVCAASNSGIARPILRITNILCLTLIVAGMVGLKLKSPVSRRQTVARKIEISTHCGRIPFTLPL
jgi:hypothetical protein